MKRFSSLRMRSQILIASFILILLTIIVALQGIVSFQTASNNFTEFYNDRFIPVQELNQILRNLLQIRINMVQQQLHAEANEWNLVSERLEYSKKLTEQYNDQWKKYKSLYMTSAEKQSASEWEKLRDKPRETRKQFETALLNRNLQLSQRLLDSWVVDFRILRDHTDKLIIHQQKKAENLQKEMAESAKTSTISSIIILIISIILGIGISIFLSRGIIRQLGSEPAELMNVANKISEGDLTVKVVIDDNDTTSAMAAMKKMVVNLRSMISNIIISSQNLAQAVEQISSGNQNMSQRTSQQASSLEEIASTIEEATAAINQNYENSTRANNISDDSAKLADEGGKLVSDAVVAINDINQTSTRIGEIISVINDIAFQTNLLALNAAVEAARAGEQGRGFAVVAGEVRNLAQRAGTSAKEIGDLIKDSIVKINTGTDKVNKSGDSLQRIIASVNNVRQMVAEITASSSEQKQGINQINDAISELDNMTQQNASLVEETASASEEMANQAQELLDMTAKFKIDENIKNGAHVTKHRELHVNAANDGNGRTKMHIKQAVQRHGDEKQKKSSALQNAQSHDSNQEIKQILKKEGFEEF